MSSSKFRPVAIDLHMRSDMVISSFVNEKLNYDNVHCPFMDLERVSFYDGSNQLGMSLCISKVSNYICSCKEV